jgi:parvulin-like peptidyl-prolyl isomerase
MEIGYKEEEGLEGHKMPGYNKPVMSPTYSRRRHLEGEPTPRRSLFLAAVFLMVCLLPSSDGLSGDVLDRVVAVVNDQVITQSELDQLIVPVYEQYKTQYKGENLMIKMDQVRQSLLHQLIEDKLVYLEAERLGVQVTEEEVNARLEELKHQFSNNQEFEDFMSTRGLTVSKLKQRYREHLAIQKLHQYQIRSRVIVTPKDVEEYYQTHREKFVEEESVWARTITIRKSKEALEAKQPDPEAKRRAEEVLRRVYGGESFEELARKYSEDTKAAAGGDLGVVRRGEFVNTIDAMVFSLKPGEISPILETEMGYHIFKVEEKKPREVKSFEKVRDNIRAFLFRKKSHERFVEWIEGLKKDAYISIR